MIRSNVRAGGPRAAAARGCVEALELRTLLSASFLGDLNVGSAGTSPANTVATTTAAFFTTLGGPNGGTRFLWKTDGTPAGSQQLFSNPAFTGSPFGNLTAARDRVYVVGSVGTTLANETDTVWTSDGTAAGTVPIIEGLKSYPSALYTNPAHDVVYFVSRVDTSGPFQLYRSDGTAADTTSVPMPSGYSMLSGQGTGYEHTGPTVMANGLFYFFATSASSGRAVFRSDGTAAGTFAVYSFSGSAQDDLTWGTDAGGMFFFRRRTGGTPQNYQLWKSDGTVAGTTLLRDAIGLSSGQFVGLNGLLYFRAAQSGFGYELWKSDATVAGTVMVRDIAGGSGSSYLGNATVANGTIWFAAGSSDINSPGTQLWKSDGTSAGTVLVTTLTSTPNGFRGAGGGNVFFQGGSKIYRTDGTAAGTRDVTPADTSNLAGFATLGSELVFTADHAIYGRELWHATGAVGGTSLLVDMTPDTFNSNPGSYVTYNGAAYFSAAHAKTTLPSGSVAAIYRTDGTAAGTSVAVDGMGMVSPTVSGSLIYFISSNSLYATNGTSAGTTNLRMFPYVPPRNLTDLNGKLVFVGQPVANLFYPFVSDGTAAGTVQLESSEYIDDASPIFMMRAGNWAYFLANSIAGKTLWKTDGTVPGTMPVKLLSSTEWNSASFLGEFNGRIYLAVRDATGYARLWACDGTPEGTVKVSDVAVEVGGTPITAVMDNALYFFGGYGTPQMGIWKTDGTATGTVPLRAVPTQLYGMAASNGVLYMDIKGSADANPAGGWTMWASNGTPEGTFPLHEYLGAAEPLPFAGRAFFYATDATYGTELWSSDGTIAGTQVVADTWPGAHGATISPRAGVAGGMLLFSSEVPGMGSEPWRWVPDSNNPVANAGGLRSVPEGSTLRLTGSAGGLPGATITTYFWDLNYDGANFDSDVTSASPSSTFDASNLDGPSTRTIAMRALDSAGRLSDPSTATITVTNSAPVGLFANDGASAWFASVGDPAAADVAAGFRFGFDFDNDGVFEMTDSASPSAVIPAAYLATTGAHTVRGRVKDKDGGFTDYATTVTVAGPAWLAVGSNATWDAGTNTLTVTGATRITADPGPDAPVVRASGAAAVVTLDAATPGAVVHLGGLVLTGGASAVLNPGRRTVVVNGGANFSVDATSRFDMSDGTLIVKGGSLPAVQALVAAGFHGGWQGVGGIESSAAASDATGSNTLGCVDNAERGLTSFGGEIGLTPGDVLVKYTYGGDANLDGQVDIGDLGLLAGAWQQSGKDWFHGDFTYDGAVDIGDLGLLAGNWQKGVGNPI